MKGKSLMSILLIASIVFMSSCSNTGSGSTNTTTASNTTISSNTTAVSNTTAASNDNTTQLADSDVKNANYVVIPATDPSKVPDVAKNRKDTYISGLSAPGGVFMPHFYQNGYDGNASNPIFASLVAVNEKGEPVPDLAEKWDISSDGLVYTFHLKKDIKFSDGSPVTADDVAFTLTLLSDPAYDGDLDLSLIKIKGAEDYKKGDATSIEGIKIIDPQTIEITTEVPNANALFMLGSSVFSKAYYGKDYKKGSLDYLKALYGAPIGAGPYKFDKYISGQEIRYIANENYYGGKPAVEHFIYKVTTADTAMQLFQTGDIDFSGFAANDDNLEQLKSLGFTDITLSTANVYSYCYMNNKKPFFQDTKVRQAMIYGLNREEFVALNYKGYGKVANVPVSPLSWAYSDDGVNAYEYNPDKAKQLLDEAGWKVGSDGIREKDGVKFKISYMTRTADDALITVAQQNYKDIGIDFTPEIMDFNAMVAKLNSGDFDLGAFSTSILLDPDDSMNEFKSDSPNNAIGYKNDKLDALIKQGVETTDIEKRKEIYKDAFKEFSNDPPLIMLAYRKSLSAISSRLDGLKIDPFNGISSSLKDVKIK